jgi:hypothetical protein
MGGVNSHDLHNGRDMFLAPGDELAFGLRRQEMALARWGWWSTNPGYRVKDFKPANRDEIPAR